MEATVDVVVMVMAAKREKPMPNPKPMPSLKPMLQQSQKLMLNQKPMPKPTTDMEGMVDMDMAEKGDQLSHIEDMVVMEAMEDTVAMAVGVMEDTVMAVNSNILTVSII